MSQQFTVRGDDADVEVGDQELVRSTFAHRLDFREAVRVSSHNVRPRLES